MRLILPSCDHITWKEIRILAEEGGLISLCLGIWSSSWEWISSLAGGIGEGKMADWPLNSWEGGLSGGQILAVGRQYDRLDEASAWGTGYSQLPQTHLRKWWAGGPEEGSCSVRWEHMRQWRSYLLNSVSLTLVCVAEKVYVKGKWDITTPKKKELCDINDFSYARIWATLIVYSIKIRTG